MSASLYSKDIGTSEVVRLFPYALTSFSPMFKTPMRPKGVVIHYTAGGSAISSMNHLRENDLGYHLLIERNGRIWQHYSLDSQCNHAGKSLWNDHYPNRDFYAVAICNYGKLLPNGKTIYGSTPQKAVLRSDEMWEPATPSQEGSLIYICRWLMSVQGISHKNICGHNECALPVGRKTDPGGSLSFSMDQLRDYLDLAGGLEHPI